MNTNDFKNITDTFKATEQMPVLFVGHGSPMNAIEENEFVNGWREISNKIPHPNAILCISAHWVTKGTHVTVMEKPQTIHDFGGFPKELFDIQYPAPGSPALAKETIDLIKKTTVEPDKEWGLDHGTWSVLKHIYPNADIPIVQLSLDYYKDASFHYELAKELKSLREKGILIVGSGNLVHNLRMIAWDKFDEPEYAYDWADEAMHKIRKYITDNDYKSLIDYRSQGNAFKLAIPTPEHYLPMLYALGLKDSNEEISLFNDKTVAGSLAMTSLIIRK